MKRHQIFLLTLLPLVLCSQGAAASPCRPGNAAVTNSNNLILLGGTARGAVKQVVAGEFGKDVNSQKRILSQFDACGDLTVADVSYDKNEHNVVLSMEQHIARVQGGWVAEYVWRVQVLEKGKAVVAEQRQGTINWQKGQHGNIISAADRFTSRGKHGFTDILYHYDRQLRLDKSVARGSDPLTNGEFHYRWNPQGLLIHTTSAHSADEYSYDPHWRELRYTAKTTTPLSTLRSTEECQSWDDAGNCTLSYLHETEIFPQGATERHLSSAYKYEYWDRPAAEE